MYSPKIREEYIPTLYKIAKQRKQPMTSLVNAIISDALSKIHVEDTEDKQDKQ